jgi:ubiquinone/menaquinone biosynthesis C-methylase UbiE
MPVYDKIFASFYDRLLASAEREGLAARRAGLVSQASGRVLEIGAGTGLNIEYYPDTLEKVVLTEPSEAMASRLTERLEASSLRGEVIIAGAEKLPFPDASFDTVVCTLVLCTVPDPDASLAEMHRVLAPGGKLLLLEHVRSESAASAAWQDRLETPWRWFGNGCRCNRDTISSVESAGFNFEELDHGVFPQAPPIVRPLIEGRAVAAPSD